MRPIVLLMCFAMAMPCASAFAQSSSNAPAVPLQEGTAVLQEDGTLVAGDEIDPNAERPDPDREIICRVIQRTESRLARRRERVCGTRTQWEMVEDQNAREVRGLGSVQTGSN